jgi:ribose 5-phosphate isomerase B
MKAPTGSDHTGFQRKATIGEYLISLGHEVIDVGADGETPSDYRDFAEKVGHAVLDRTGDRAALICGSGGGSGVSLARHLVAAFLGAKFANEERHVRRLGKIAKMEDTFCDKSAWSEQFRSSLQDFRVEHGALGVQ